MGTIDWIKKHPAATAGIATFGYGMYKHAKYGTNWWETKNSWIVNIIMIILFLIACRISNILGVIFLIFGILNGLSGNQVACLIAEHFGDERRKQTQYRKVI